MLRHAGTKKRAFLLKESRKFQRHRVAKAALGGLSE